MSRTAAGGCWGLGPSGRSTPPSADTPEGLVPFVVEISDFESFGKKKAIIGTRARALFTL
jgi:hypothetical protein